MKGLIIFGMAVLLGSLMYFGFANDVNNIDGAPENGEYVGYLNRVDVDVCKMTVGKVLWEFYVGKVLKGCELLYVCHPHKSGSYTSPKLWDFFDGGGEI